MARDSLEMLRRRGAAKRNRSFHRRLRMEALENRHLLAVFTVTNLLDGPVSQFGQLPGSLRQAVFDANEASGADTIAMSGVLGTLKLTAGEFEITDSLTINGLGPNQLTINAQQQSRIFDVTGPLTSFSLAGMTLTGGKTTGSGSFHNQFAGGAVRLDASGTLTIDRCSIVGNSTTGSDAPGGGVFSYAAPVTITNSTISGNSTAGSGSYGGGVYSQNGMTLTNCIISGNSTSDAGGGLSGQNITVTNSKVIGNSTTGAGAAAGGGVAGTGTITNSIISGNSTAGVGAVGGGVSGAFVIISSTVSGNSTTGNNASGGGIFCAQLTLTGSMVSGNHTMGEYAFGGGVAGGDLTITGSTINGNYTAGFQAMGGGIFSTGDVTLKNSTFSGNSTTGPFAYGGGIMARKNLSMANCTVVGNSAMPSDMGGVAGGVGVGLSNTVTISNSIIAGNTAGGVSPDLTWGGDAFQLKYSLIGNNAGTPLVAAPVGSPDANGNLIGTAAAPINAMLSALSDHGGPTFLDGSRLLVHALAAGSPAIDTADPAATGAPANDERGAPFVRVFNGDGVSGARLDMGAFELQPVPPATFGDYNRNAVVDAGDFVLWRKTKGATGLAAYSGADGDGDTTIDADDYTVWKNHFGQTVPATGAGGEASVEGIGNGELGTGSAEEVVARVSLTKSEAIEQPPALPGVRAALPFSYASQASEWRVHGDGRARLVPPAEPGAAKLLRDQALVAWLESRGVSPQSDSGAMPAGSDGHDRLFDEGAVGDAMGELGAGLVALV